MFGKVLKVLQRWTGRFGNRKGNRDHPKFIIVVNSQNTEKNPGNLRKHAVTQTPMKNRQITPV